MKLNEIDAICGLASVSDVSVFLDKSQALNIVREHLKEDVERQKDVAKMLNVLYSQMYKRENDSPKMREALDQRKRNRGKVKLVLTKNKQGDFRNWKSPCFFI